MQDQSDATSVLEVVRWRPSVSVLVADKASTLVYTGQLALDLDEDQYGRGYGSCLHAAGTGEPVEVSGHPHRGPVG